MLLVGWMRVWFLRETPLEDLMQLGNNSRRGHVIVVFLPI